MSTVDPTKPKPITFSPLPPPSPPKNEKKAVDLETAIEGPKPDFSKFVALNGPGVAGKVFGPKYGDPRTMTDAQLASAITKMATAMKSNVGIVNDADMKLYGAMVKVAAERETSLLNSKKPVGEMDNRELLHHAMAFDIAKASGTKLTADQEKRHGVLSSAVKEREKGDVSGDMKRLSHVRAEVEKTMVLQCTAAAATAAGLATHVSLPAMVASGLIIADDIQHGHLLAAGADVALFVAARLPASHHAAELASLNVHGAACEVAAIELHTIEKNIKLLEPKVKP